MDILLDNITKRFGDKTVFENFTHRFKNESVTAVFGESGCGKTTLLRIICGLDKDYEGRILPSEPNVSVAFQEPRLYPGATVLENIEIFDKNDTGRDLLIKLGIEKENSDKFPSELSGGMARRVSLVRAMVKSADVYLFDEPFAGLDKENAENTAEVIKEFSKGKTCIIVTHNEELAKIFATDFLYL